MNNCYKDDRLLYIFNNFENDFSFINLISNLTEILNK